MKYPSSCSSWWQRQQSLDGIKQHAEIRNLILSDLLENFWEPHHLTVPLAKVQFLKSLYECFGASCYLPVMKSSKMEKSLRTSLVIQWLRLHASNAGVMHLIPGQGSSTCHAAKKKRKSHLSGHCKDFFYKTVPYHLSNNSNFKNLNYHIDKIFC